MPILVFWGAGEAKARFRPRLPPKPNNKPRARPGCVLGANGVLEARERKTGVGFLAAARENRKSGLDNAGKCRLSLVFPVATRPPPVIEARIYDMMYKQFEEVRSASRTATVQPLCKWLLVLGKVMI